MLKLNAWLRMLKGEDGKGRIQDKMFCCKNVNWENYKVAIEPEGISRRFKFPSIYSKADIESSVYYLFPCFNGLPITFVLKAIGDSDKQSTALKYQWKISFADKRENIERHTGKGYLRILNKDDRTLQDSFTIASEHILIPGQYNLQIQLLRYDDSAVMKWYQLASFNVINWDTFFVFALGLLLGLAGTVISLVVQVILEVVKH